MFTATDDPKMLSYITRHLLCTTGGEGGGESWIIYLDLLQDVSPPTHHQHQGGVILGAMHRGSFKL